MNCLFYRTRDYALRSFRFPLQIDQDSLGSQCYERTSSFSLREVKRDAIKMAHGDNFPRRQFSLSRFSYGNLDLSNNHFPAYGMN